METSARQCPEVLAQNDAAQQASIQISAWLSQASRDLPVWKGGQDPVTLALEAVREGVPQINK